MTANNSVSSFFANFVTKKLPEGILLDHISVYEVAFGERNRSSASAPIACVIFDSQGTFEEWDGLFNVPTLVLHRPCRLTIVVDNGHPTTGVALRMDKVDVPYQPWTVLVCDPTLELGNSVMVVFFGASPAYPAYPARIAAKKTCWTSSDVGRMLKTSLANPAETLPLNTD